MNKVSVIIPVYNTEQFLSQCLNSIVHQTHKNLEIIIVNDGSKDNSDKICQRFAKIDKRIKIIYQKKSRPHGRPSRKTSHGRWSPVIGQILSAILFPVILFVVSLL